MALASTAISGLGAVSTVGADDMAGISQGGADRAIRVEDFLDGQMIERAISPRWLLA